MRQVRGARIGSFGDSSSPHGAGFRRHFEGSPNRGIHIARPGNGSRAHNLYVIRPSHNASSWPSYQVRPIAARVPPAVGTGPRAAARDSGSHGGTKAREVVTSRAFHVEGPTMKRWPAALCAIAIVVAAAACGGSDSKKATPTAGSGAASPAASAAVAKSSGSTTLKLVFLGDMSVPGPDVVYDIEGNAVILST